MKGRRRAARPGLSQLSAGHLGARRAAWRRRRARQRMEALLVVAAVAVGVVALVLRHSSAASRAPSTLAGPAPPRSPVRHQGSTVSLHKPAPGPYQSVDRVLRYTSYVRLGAGRRRDVALTFDDGPGPYTSSIIGVLRRFHVPATFFVIGRQVPLYRHVVGEEAHDGFEVGDHTWSHPFLSVLPASIQRAQIVDAAAAVRRAGAPSPRLFRPPYGSFSPTTLAILHSLHMLVVLWSVDTSDYLRPGVARIVYVALSGARPGAIILMHDGGGDRAETVDALPRIILGLRRRGYRLVTLSQLAGDDPPPRHQPPPTPLSGYG
jgi:peptidoglycan-N-acetylglucosamine deacetylase